jgi:hypothetical protein
MGNLGRKPLKKGGFFIFEKQLIKSIDQWFDML